MTTDFRPQLPDQGPPLPRALGLRWPWANAPTETKSGQVIEHCRYGLECIKNHLLRSHLFMSEALRFSAAGEITPEAQQKIRQAREQLLCEDDFQRALEAPPSIQAQVMQLLASTRSTWKAIDSSGVDHGFGTPDDLRQVAEAIEDLSKKAYEIDRQYRTQEDSNGKKIPVPKESTHQVSG